MLQPINYYNALIPDYRKEALMETQNRLGQAQLSGLNIQNMQMQQQMQDQQLQRQQQQTLNQQISQAWGNPQAMSELMTKNPQAVDYLQKMMGVQNDNHRMALGNAARDLGIAMQSGNPQAIAQAATHHSDALSSIGSSPQEIMQMAMNDPQTLNQTIEAVRMGTFSPNEYYGVQDKQQGREIERGRLAESMRNNRASEALQSRGQDIQIRGQDISAENARLDREIKKAEFAQKSIDRQLANETNQIKRDDLLMKQQAAQKKATEAKADRYDNYAAAYEASQRSIDAADRIMNSPGFTGYFGTNINPFSSRWIPGTDAADTQAQVETLGSQIFLSMVSQMKGMGALSNAEGAKLQAAIGSLSSSMSEKEAKRSLSEIKNTLTQGQDRLNTKYKDESALYRNNQAEPARGSNNYASLWGD
ncbi:phage DNA ejection protein [Xenorhabdus nematophila]|uniref:phage DNA ejection protein n=1 Tax=Xenorhabdus nematophila TaxID=628 RepID=UPI0032B82ABC